MQAEIKSGRYSSASEVVGTGLRLLEIEKKKIQGINKALSIGEESGKPIVLDNNKFKARMKKKFKLDA